MRSATRNAFCALFLSLLLSTLFAASPALAQKTGTIAGTIVDAESGETLIGANAVVVGTSTGAAADLNGRYEIKGLDPGTYSVKYSFTGFQPKTVEGIEVAAGQTTTLDVSLSSQAVGMKEVTVTAEAARNSEAGLLKNRQKAAAVSDAISAEAISQSGSSDAADAMEKVTGASVTDGKYVSVRGLGGRYVNTTLNGAALPSADPEEDSVPFDLFPASLLQNIVISKTFTPDRSGSFTGGSIDIGTVAFPSQLELTVSSSVGYNTAASYGASRVGYANGLSSVPAAVSAGPMPSRGEALGDPAAAQRLSEVARAFGGALTPTTEDVPLEQGYEISFGNEFSVLGDRAFGVVGSFSYDQNVSGYESGQTGRFVLNSPGSSALSPELNLSDESVNIEDLYAGLANVSFRPASGQELGVNLLYTRSEEQRARFQEGFSSELSSATLQTSTLRRTERSVRSGQVRGEHIFAASALENLYGVPSGGIVFDWKGALSRTSQEEPDFRLFANDFFPEDRFPNRTQRYQVNVSSYEAPTRYFRTLEEDGRTAEASLLMPVADVLDVKIGGSYSHENREFRQRRFLYNLGLNYEGNPEVFFGERTGLTDVNRDGVVEETELGNIIEESTRQADNYDGEQTITAGFAMIDMQVGKLLERLGGGEVPVLSDLRLIGGARVEQTDQRVESQSDDAGDNGRISETDVLPSVNLVYAVTDNMNVRAAYGRTLARPSFQEFAPITFQEFIAAYPTKGNPNLERTLINNFDVRWEWFPRAGEILALSGFYKDFTGAIESTFDPLANNPTITYFNSDEATVYGVELEARKQLDFIGGALRNLSAGANLTLARSEAKDEEISAGSGNTRPFEGQSDYLVNADVEYKNPNIGTNVSLYYNVFGERLDTIVRDAAPAEALPFEQPRHTLDFTASQRLVPFGLSGMKISFKAKNILGADYEITRTYEGQSYTMRSYELGRSFSLGLEYSL